MVNVKLLYIMSSFYPAQSGGPNNTIYWQAKALVKKGIDVTVVTTMRDISEDLKDRYNIKENNLLEIDGIKIIYFHYQSKYFIPLTLYKWLNKNIKNYDLISLNSYFLPINWLSSFMSIKNKKDFFIAPRGELEDNALVYNKKLKKVMMWLFLKKLYNRSKFVLVTSQQELEFSKRFFRSDMDFKILPNYIEVNENLKNINVENKKDILYLGRIHPKKGIENLIKAYSKLDKNIKQKHKLKIAGKGQVKYLNFLKDLVKQCNEENNILFVGHKEGKGKEELYKNSKLFVLPSHSENFGNVVLESLMYKTPVIASIYTPWQELEKYKCGFWIDNTPDEIEKHIKEVINMPDFEYKELSENAFKFVNERYNIENNIDNLINTIF